MNPDWRALLLYQGDDKTTYGDRFAVFREMVTAGRARDVFDEAVEMGVGLHQAGLDREALGLLDELATFVGPPDVDAEQWPWFFNTRAMALGGLARYEEAEAEYVRMRDLAEQLPDEAVRKHIVSTALQNRGINAVEAGDADRAIPLLRDAGLAKLELDDFVGAIDVLNTLGLAVADKGDLDEAERILDDVMDLAAKVGEPRRVGNAFGNRGVLKARRGDYEGAEEDLRAALKYARAEGDPMREAQSVMSVGSTFVERGEFGKALRWYRRAAASASKRGMVVLEAQLRRATALTLLQLGRAAEAVPEMHRALELYTELEHAFHKAEALADLGALHVELGEYELAREELERARAAFVEVGNPAWQSQAVRNLAEMTLQTDGPAAAEELWEHAIELLDEFPMAAADTAHRAAEAWLFSQEADSEARASARARGAAERWLRVELDRASRYEEGTVLAWRTANAGALLNWRDRNEAGLRLLEEALSEYEDLDEPGQETSVRMDVAAALTDLGRHDEAIAVIERCLKDSVERSDRITRQRALGNLGEVLRRTGDLERARSVLEESEELARALDDDESRAHVLGNLGLVQFESGDAEAALRTFTAQYELARRLRLRSETASALGGLGNIALARGHSARAAGYYRRAARLHQGIWSVGEVEDLGGLLHSLAEARKHAELEPVAQQLVNVAQDARLHEKAAAAFAGTGRVLLGQGELDAAAAFYSTALQLRLSAAAGEPKAGDEQADPETAVEQEAVDAEVEDDLPATVKTLIHSLGLMAAQIEVDLPEDERDPFYERVLGDLDRAHEGIADLIRPLLETVRSGLAEQGVFDELRGETEKPDPR